MSTATRRQAFPTHPGEPLLLPRSTVDQAVRQQMWSEATCLDRGDQVETTLVSMPIPLYLALAGEQPRPGQYDRRRAFPHVNAGILWHPLFWLPPRLACRYRFATPDGGVFIESDEEWAVRIALEVSQSGLYDEESGTWLDVLSMVGLDAMDPVDIARVEAWQAGAPDPLLDGIDLTAMTDIEERHWALELAAQLVEPLREASWALCADDLAEMAAETALSARSGQLDAAGAAQAALTMLSLAAATLSDVPIAGGTLARTWQQYRADVETSAGRPLDELLEGPLARAASLLYDVRETYWSTVEDLTGSPVAVA